MGGVEHHDVCVVADEPAVVDDVAGVTIEV
jgi:hypothetical protein